MIALDTTTFLMDLCEYSKDLYDFLPSYGPQTMRTQRQGSHRENECDLFWH